MVQPTGGLLPTVVTVSATMAEALEGRAAEDHTPLATLVRQLLGREMRDDAGLRGLPDPVEVRGPGLPRIALLLTTDQMRWLDAFSPEIGCTRSALIRALLARALGDGLGDETEAA